MGNYNEFFIEMCGKLAKPGCKNCRGKGIQGTVTAVGTKKGGYNLSKPTEAFCECLIRNMREYNHIRLTFKARRTASAQVAA